MTKNGTDSSGRMIWFFAAAFVCVTIAGFIWLVHGWLDLFSHIMPTGSANIALSTSMEPFDIAVKTQVWDDQKGEAKQIVEWNLKVPRAYVSDLRGEKGGISKVVRDENGNFSWKSGLVPYLALHVQDDDMTPEPYSKMEPSQRKFDDNTMVISFGGGDANWWIVKNDLCVPQDKYAEFSRKYDAGPGSNLDCFKTIKFCYFFTHLDGWGIKINVTKRLYAQPEKVCAMAKKFLKQYTVKRDVYPYSEPIHYKFPRGSNGANN